MEEQKKRTRRKREEGKKEAPDSEWKERDVKIRRGTNVVKGGKKLWLRAFVVLGNSKGTVGGGGGITS